MNTSPNLFIPKNPWIETLRKAAQRAGFCHDVISLNHESVLLQMKNDFNAGPLKTKDGLPKFLLRVDDFPAEGIDSDCFRQFHLAAKKWALPYLIGVTPFLKQDGLSDREFGLLEDAAREGAEIALHGFTHRRVSRSCASELLGMNESTLRGHLLQTFKLFEMRGLRPQVFIAPYNSYDPLTVPVLEEFFDVLCGGPESVKCFGYRIPSKLNSAYYLPSYRLAYDIRRSQLRAFDRMVSLAGGQVIPITIHWANEYRDGFSTFDQLAKRIQGRTLHWKHWLASFKSGPQSTLS